MKKIYTFSILFISAIAFGQSVVITTIVDGTLGPDGCASTNGTSSPKIAEMYVSGTVDFTNYRFQIESNGAADASLISWSAGLDLTPLGTVTNSFVYLVGLGATTFNEMYPSIVLPAFSAASVNGNGNDAYRIAITDGAMMPETLSVVDQFGDPLDIPTGSADYSAIWAYQDSFAKRNDGVAANGGAFVSSSFTYGGNGAFVNPNNNCAFLVSAINLGSFVLANKTFAVSGMKVYPNPVVDGNLYISSDSSNAKQLTVYDVAGRVALKTTATDQPVNVSGLSSGIYLAHIAENGKTTITKLVIR
jgi:hypothetical protein